MMGNLRTTRARDWNRLLARLTAAALAAFLVIPAPATARIVVRGSSVRLDQGVPTAFGPHAFGRQVVWTALPAAGELDYEIYARLPDGSTTRLTDNALHDFSPLTDGSAVAWLSFDGGAIHVWGSATPTATPSRLDPDSTTSRDLALVGGLAVWVGHDGNDDEIYAWDPSTGTTSKLTDNSVDDGHVSVSERLVVWVAAADTDGDVWTYDRNSGTTSALSADAFRDSHTATGGNWVAWVSEDAGGRVLRAWDGVRTQVLGPAKAVAPVVEPGHIAWIGADDQVWAADGRLGASIPRVLSYTTDNYDLTLQRGRLSWLGSDNGAPHDVFVSDFESDEPLALGVAAEGPLGGISVNTGSAYWTGSTGGDHVWATDTVALARHQGRSRYATAASISGASYPEGAQTVVLATGERFPDALCGAPLAAALDAPMLLTHPGILSPEAIGEILRLGASRVVILGGPKAVSEAVESQVTALLGPSGTVERVAGASRYETSAQIAQRLALEIGPSWPTSPTAMVATGAKFPDALSGGSAAAALGWPILLTHPETLTTETANAVSGLGVGRTYVLGGSSAVGDDVLAALPSAERIWGADRYGTSRAITQRALAEGWLEPYEVVIATGRKFPDALVGGGLAARRGAAVVLTLPDKVSQETIAALSTSIAAESMRMHVLGGAFAVSEPVASALFTVASGGGTP